MTIPALRDVPGVAAQAPAETTGFVFNHTMLRVKDIAASLDFYTRVLGYQLIDKRDFPRPSSACTSWPTCPLASRCRKMTTPAACGWPGCRACWN